MRNQGLEGVAGPTVSVGPHVGAEAELTLSPLDKKWSEKANFKAGITLDVNAEAGAKLKILGYELAEFKTTFKLVGPWLEWLIDHMLNFNNYAYNR